MKMGKSNLVMLIVTVLSISISCTNTNSNKEEVTSNAANNTNVINYEITKQQTNDFLNWYKLNYDAIASIELLNKQEDTTTIYSINFSKVEELLALFQKSNFVSDKFITDKTKFYKKCNQSMQKEKQTDGPPYGLDYDAILLTQDVDYTLDAITNATYSNFTSTKNYISIDVKLLNQLRFFFSQENNTLKIDSIGLVIEK